MLYICPSSVKSPCRKFSGNVSNEYSRVYWYRVKVMGFNAIYKICHQNVLYTGMRPKNTKLFFNTMPVCKTSVTYPEHSAKLPMLVCSF